MSAAAFQDAFVKYLTQFPDLASLGEGDPPAAWQAELEAVSPGAFATIRESSKSTSFDGGSYAVSGTAGFAPMHLVRALYAVRAHRDPDFVNPYTVAAVDARPSGRQVLRFS